MTYKTVRAIRQSNVPIKVASDGRFFVVFVCSDKKQYQVKFNIVHTKGNQNELITHYIGSKMNAPVLNGCFIEFSPRILSSILEQMEKESPHIDKNCYKACKMFGVEWHEGARFARSESEVSYFHSICKNKNDFYAIYPFDQLLRNYDRQYFNHIIIKKEKEKKPSHYYATIDGDKIFHSAGWWKLDKEAVMFSCFSEKFHKLLYNLVDEEAYKIVRKFAINIYKISDDEINTLQKTMNDIYTDVKNEHSKITDILKDRKYKVIDYCDGNCFSKVKYKRLSLNGSSRI